MNRIRPARPDEAVELTRLCLRSKAHWGYDAAFLAASTPALTVTPERIARGRVLVAEDARGIPLGVAAAEPMDDGFDLALLFVAPEAIGRGIGESLFEGVVALIAREGARRLLIEADPNAAGFYERCGARRIGDVPSESIPGRMLPLFEFAIA